MKTIFFLSSLVVLAACESKVATAPAADAGASSSELVQLAPGAASGAGLQHSKVEPRALSGELELVGSVAPEPARDALVGPLVHGRVAQVLANAGDRVSAGAVLAWVESPEVGEAQAAWIAALARTEAAERDATREAELYTAKVTSAREFEAAQAHAKAEEAVLQGARERLLALGMSQADLALAAKGKSSGGKVALRAPIAGVVVDRKVRLGQAVERATDAFRVLDVSVVSVSLDLFEADLARVAPNEPVEVHAAGRSYQSTVSFVSPLIDPATRTAQVKLVVANDDGALRPGQFVTARLKAAAEGQQRAVLTIPAKAIQLVEGDKVVFVKTAEGYRPRKVKVGASDGEVYEVLDGLSAGEQVVSSGAFLLKSEMLR